MGCDSPLKGWKDRDTGGIVFRRDNAGEKMEVACGQCLGCRLDHSRMWAMRIIHESSLHEYNGGNCFVTLTYRDKKDCTVEQLKLGQHVPDDWSLHKSHMTLFLKRLRSYFDEKRIKFFYAGEYGKKCQHGIELERVKCPMCNHGRPHYHACLFNISFPDLEPYQSDGGIMRYTSPILEMIWGYGFVDVGTLNYNTAMYTTKYLLKKMGPKHPDHYMQYTLDGEVTWLEPEFANMSRGHRCAYHKKLGYTSDECDTCSRGIGYHWFKKFASDVFPSDEVPIPGAGVMNGVPRYYNEIYKEDHPEEYAEIQARREVFKKEHAEEYTHSRLLQKHKCKKARVNMNKRNLV